MSFIYDTDSASGQLTFCRANPNALNEVLLRTRPALLLLLVEIHCREFEYPYVLRFPRHGDLRFFLIQTSVGRSFPPIFFFSSRSGTASKSFCAFSLFFSET